MAKLTDGSGRAVEQTYSLGIAASAGPLFKDGFESGGYASWNEKTTTQFITMNSDPAYVRTGNYSMRIQYQLCGDSTNTLCGAAHQNADKAVTKYFNSTNGYPNGLEHFFIRGYVMFHLLPGSTPTVQRKLFYLKDPGLKSGGIDWSAVMAGAPGSLAWHMQVGGATYCGAGPTSWTFGSYTFDIWYSVEVEVKANTPGSSDGEVRVWINGSKLLDRTGVNVRGTCTTGITRFAVGEQVDRFNYDPVDEYRWWDDIVISTSYIGP